MQNGTERLKAIADAIADLVRDAKDNKAFVPNVGRVGIAGLTLQSILREAQDRDVRVAAMADRPGGLDYSTPVGDR